MISKLAAVIKKGVNPRIKKADFVLYLGAGHGVTPAIVSDIVGKDGFVFCIEISKEPMKKLLQLCKKKANMTALLADANKPETYARYFEKIKADYIYQDIAQHNQAEIFLKNCKAFLKKDGFALLCVKARSIDVTKKPEIIFKQTEKELKKELEIIEKVRLEPYQKDHCVFICKKR